MPRGLEQPGGRSERAVRSARSKPGASGRAEGAARSALPCPVRGLPGLCRPLACPGAGPCLSFPTPEGGREGCHPALGVPLALTGGECGGSCRHRAAAFTLRLRIPLNLKQDPARLKTTRFAFHTEGINWNEGAHRKQCFTCWGGGGLQQRF